MELVCRKCDRTLVLSKYLRIRRLIQTGPHPGSNPAMTVPHRHARTCCGHPRLPCCKDVDGIGTRACPSSVDLNVTSRVNATCGDKSGQDEKKSDQVRGRLFRDHALWSMIFSENRFP